MNTAIQRIRLETRMRLPQVIAVTRISPLMQRITLGGPELEGFLSPGYADHIKVLLFPEGQEPVKPELHPEGFVFPDEVKRPAARDYTPRRFDAEALRLDIDFVLHGEGPASSWAARAKVGDRLLIGGPRGTLLVPSTFEWYLLVGDETALPAIGRRIEELPQGARAIALIEVEDEAEEQQFASAADVTIHWLHRHGRPAGTPGLEAALAQLRLPDGLPYCFAAAEGSVTRGIRRHLTEDRGYEVGFIRASGYWLREVAGATERQGMGREGMGRPGGA